MAWATAYIDKLKNGEAVGFRPRGNSMTPKIESGALCIVEPIGDTVLKVGDIVLCKVSGRQYLHLISAIRHNSEFQISNNKGHINGWINKNSIYGILKQVDNS